MKLLILAAALACVLSASAIAGEIPSTGAPVPPPPACNSMLVTVLITIISIAA